MNEKQNHFLENLTADSARALLRKFDNDPATAFEKSDEAFCAFRECWEFLNPSEYIQHVWRGTADHQFHCISK